MHLVVFAVFQLKENQLLMSNSDRNAESKNIDELAQQLKRGKELKRGHVYAYTQHAYESNP